MLTGGYWTRAVATTSEVEANDSRALHVRTGMAVAAALHTGS